MQFCPHNNYVIFLISKKKKQKKKSNNNNKCWKINKRKRENNNWWKLPLRLKEIWKKKKKNTETLGFLESFVANSSITGARICFSCERFVHWFRRRRLIFERPEALNIHGTWKEDDEDDNEDGVESEDNDATRMMLHHD